MRRRSIIVKPHRGDLDIYLASAYDTCMSHEGLSPATTESVFYEDGQLNEAVLANQYGIGVEEAQQEITFGGYTGTVAQMLDDERCPVGGMVATAYQEKGIDGVAEQFKNLGVMDPNFSVEISPATLERESVKKK